MNVLNHHSLPGAEEISTHKTINERAVVFSDLICSLDKTKETPCSDALWRLNSRNLKKKEKKKREKNSKGLLVHLVVYLYCVISKLIYVPDPS